MHGASGFRVGLSEACAVVMNRRFLLMVVAAGWSLAATGCSGKSGPGNVSVSRQRLQEVVAQRFPRQFPVAGMLKALEFPLALWLDLVLGKRRLMEIYLNIAEWGPNGEFGAEAAARHAFGKPAHDLTLREAALLAAILPNPAVRSAGRPSAGVRRVVGIYEARAARLTADCLRRPD